MRYNSVTTDIQQCIEVPRDFKRELKRNKGTIIG